jgi:hypothetical protein
MAPQRHTRVDFWAELKAWRDATLESNLPAPGCCRCATSPKQATHAEQPATRHRGQLRAVTTATREKGQQQGNSHQVPQAVCVARLGSLTPHTTQRFIPSCSKPRVARAISASLAQGTHWADSLRRPFLLRSPCLKRRALPLRAKSGNPKSPSEHCLNLQSDARPTEPWPECWRAVYVGADVAVGRGEGGRRPANNEGRGTLNSQPADLEPNLLPSRHAPYVATSVGKRATVQRQGRPPRSRQQHRTPSQLKLLVPCSFVLLVRWRRCVGKDWLDGARERGWPWFRQGAGQESQQRGTEHLPDDALGQQRGMEHLPDDALDEWLRRRAAKPTGSPAWGRVPRVSLPLGGARHGDRPREGGRSCNNAIAWPRATGNATVAARSLVNSRDLRTLFRDRPLKLDRRRED